MRRLLLVLGLLVATITAACSRGTSQPPTVLLVHGFNGHGAFDCSQLDPLGQRLGHALKVGLYAADTHCDVPGPAGATVQTTIEELARHVAVVARQQKGPVDLVGHSMGSLVVVLAARDLPVGKVHRVVALGGPFGGLPTSAGCPTVVQCDEMAPGSPLLTGLHPDPDLCVGSTADEVVPIASALAATCRHQLRVDAIHHGEMQSSALVADAVRKTLRG